MPTQTLYPPARRKSREILDLGALAPSARKVYHAIHAYIRRFPTAFPSQERIAKNTGLSVRQVRRAILSLRVAGILEVCRDDRARSRHRTNRYTLSIPWQILNRPAPQSKTKTCQIEPVSSQNVLSTKLKALSQKRTPQPPTKRPWGASISHPRSLRATGKSPRQLGKSPRQRRNANSAAFVGAVLAEVPGFLRLAKREFPRPSPAKIYTVGHAWLAERGDKCGVSGNSKVGNAHSAADERQNDVEHLLANFVDVHSFVKNGN